MIIDYRMTDGYRLPYTYQYCVLTIMHLMQCLLTIMHLMHPCINIYINSSEIFLRLYNYSNTKMLIPTNY